MERVTGHFLCGQCDNEAARFCLMKGSSPPSNLADLPSRQVERGLEIVGVSFEGDIQLPNDMIRIYPWKRRANHMTDKGGNTGRGFDQSPDKVMRSSSSLTVSCSS